MVPEFGASFAVVCAKCRQDQLTEYHVKSTTVSLEEQRLLL